MAAERYTHKLTGCAPIPLASYLKALGILRLISEQKADPNANGWWEGDSFYLETTLPEKAVMQFFVEMYRPTAIVAPWNGGSGFFPKDNKTSIEAIVNGNATRLQNYRDTIEAAKTVLKQLGLTEKPDGDSKGTLLVGCRAQFPDEALSSLDAAYVLTEAGPKYPPLLGTGLNDGRLEFSNNFMQRLLDLIDPQSGNATSKSACWLKESLFPEVQDELQRDSILGQFDPGAVERPVNPWDFVLMLEGALVFAAAAVKRHEASTKGTLSYPFSVRAAGVGYGSSSSSDEESSRAEMWLPLWNHPASFAELQILMAEGRVQVNGRAARNGIDFARAIATLGIDRGITNFVRFGFHARNGLAYFAVPLGRFRAVPQPQVDLLSQIDGWLDSFRRAASTDTAPASAGRALRQLDAAILELCRSKGIKQLQEVLIALGNAQQILSTSQKWSNENYQRPVPPYAVTPFYPQ